MQLTPFHFCCVCGQPGTCAWALAGVGEGAFQDAPVLPGACR